MMDVLHEHVSVDMVCEEMFIAALLEALTSVRRKAAGEIFRIDGFP